MSSIAKRVEDARRQNPMSATISPAFETWASSTVTAPAKTRGHAWRNAPSPAAIGSEMPSSRAIQRGSLTGRPIFVRWWAPRPTRNTPMASLMASPAVEGALCACTGCHR